MTTSAPLTPYSRWSGFVLHTRSMMNNNDTSSSVFLAFEPEVINASVEAMYEELSWDVFLPYQVPFLVGVDQLHDGRIVSSYAPCPVLRVRGAGEWPLSMEALPYGASSWIIHHPAGDRIARRGDERYATQIRPLLCDESLDVQMRVDFTPVPLDMVPMVPSRPRCPLFERHGRDFLTYLEDWWSGVIPVPPLDWDGGVSLNQHVPKVFLAQEDDDFSEWLEERALMA